VGVDWDQDGGSNVSLGGVDENVGRMFCDVKHSNSNRWGLVHFLAKRLTPLHSRRPKTWTCPLAWREGDNPQRTVTSNHRCRFVRRRPPA